MLKIKNNGIVTFISTSLICLGLFLAQNTSAGSGSYSSNKNEQLTSANQTAQYYCDRADQSQSPEREANWLLCANAFLKVNKVPEAKTILTKIKNFPFEGNLLSFKQLVDARYALAIGNPTRAITLLKNISISKLSSPVAIEYRDLLARAYEKEGNYLQSVVERVELDSQLSDRDLASLNNALIWSTLQQINLQSLQGAAKSTTHPMLKGWLELAIIEREMNSNDLNYVNTLAKWQSEFRGHPGESLLPDNVSRAVFDDLKPKHIALLLPLSGKLSSSAVPIRDGFLAAARLRQQQTVDTPQISVIDTQNDQQVANAYDTAMSQGADMIVGPLTKNGVEQIIRIARGNVPVLALNTVDERTSSNVFQFGLSPEDEARQAAERAWQDGHMNALIIAQTGDWGDRITRAFQDRWESLGGQVVNITTYSLNQPLSNAVKSALKIDTSDSRAKQLREDINQSIEYDSRRRQDIDMIFMVAQPQEARQLPPLFAFYFAHDLPIYATSSVYSGYPNPIADKDLNDVTFCDIPWNVDSRPEATSNSSPTVTLWPSIEQPNQRLFALGVDAFQVIPLLPRLEALPNFSLNGATGRLSLDKNRRITRGLRCTQFISGEVKRLGSNG